MEYITQKRVETIKEGENDPQKTISKPEEMETIKRGEDSMKTVMSQHDEIFKPDVSGNLLTEGTIKSKVTPATIHISNENIKEEKTLIEKENLEIGTHVRQVRMPSGEKHADNLKTQKSLDNFEEQMEKDHEKTKIKVKMQRSVTIEKLKEEEIFIGAKCQYLVTHWFTNTAFHAYSISEEKIEKDYLISDFFGKIKKCGKLIEKDSETNIERLSIRNQAKNQNILEIWYK